MCRHGLFGGADLGPGWCRRSEGSSDEEEVDMDLTVKDILESLQAICNSHKPSLA